MLADWPFISWFIMHIFNVIRGHVVFKIMSRATYVSSNTAYHDTLHCAISRSTII